MKVKKSEYGRYFTDNDGKKGRQFKKVFGFVGTLLFGFGLCFLFYVMYIVCYACM